MNGGRARRNDPKTSQRAADQVEAARLRLQIWQLLKQHGPMASHRIARVHLGGDIMYGSTTPRLSELEERGLVRRAGTVYEPNAETLWEAIDPEVDPPGKPPMKNPQRIAIMELALQDIIAECSQKLISVSTIKFIATEALKKVKKQSK